MPVAYIDSISITSGSARVVAKLGDKTVASATLSQGQELKIGRADNVFITGITEAEGVLVAGRTYKFKVPAEKTALIYFDYDVMPLFLVPPVGVAGIAYLASRLGLSGWLRYLALAGGALVSSILGVILMPVVPLATTVPIGAERVKIVEIDVEGEKGTDVAIAVMLGGKVVYQHETTIPDKGRLRYILNLEADTVYVTSDKDILVTIRHENGTDQFQLKGGQVYKIDYDAATGHFKAYVVQYAQGETS